RESLSLSGCDSGASAASGELGPEGRAAGAELGLLASGWEPPSPPVWSTCSSRAAALLRLGEKIVSALPSVYRRSCFSAERGTCRIHSTPTTCRKAGSFSARKVYGLVTRPIAISRVVFIG